MDRQNITKQRGYKLAVVGNTFIYPIAGCFRKIKTLAELKPDGTIVIPNDPTNGALVVVTAKKWPASPLGQCRVVA